MPPLPPLKYVLDALHQCVLPGAGGAALVLAAFLLLGWRAAALGSAVAVVVAFMWGNYEPTLPKDEPTPAWTNSHRLLFWKPAEDAPDYQFTMGYAIGATQPGWKPEVPGFQWLPRAALVLVIVGLLSRWLGLGANRVLPERAWWTANIVVWLPRVVAVVAVSAWPVTGVAARNDDWMHLRWELIGAILLVWIVADSFARGGFSAEVSAYLGASLFAAGGVLLYAGTGKFMELAVVLGSAMFGIAAVTAIAKRGVNGQKVLATGAIPAAVVFLVGLVLGGRPSLAEEHKVPQIAFWLAALAPILLAPFLIPPIARQNKWVLLAIRASLVLAPLVVAVGLAAKYEKLPYEKEKEDEWSRHELLAKPRAA